MVKAVEYVDGRSRSPFGDWLQSLDAMIAAKVVTAIVRMEKGNFSNAKALTGGLYEYRLMFGAGCRIYFGRDGEDLVILLAGGSKRRQSRDIEMARSRWDDYQRRKSEA